MTETVPYLTDADVMAVAARTGWHLVDSVSHLGRQHRAWKHPRCPVTGQCTLFLVLDPDEVIDPDLRQVTYMRHVAMFEGRCPACDARQEVPNRAERRRAKRAGEVIHGFMEHEHDCPVSDDAIRAAVAAKRN